MAFGDGINDIELLEQADFSFAMRNAFDETKAVAKFINGLNDESAVMKTIQLMLGLQSKTNYKQQMHDMEFFKASVSTNFLNRCK